MTGTVKPRAAAMTLAMILVALTPTGADACSTFMLRDEGVLIVGHNLDETPGFRVPGMLCVNKRGVRKKGLSYADVVAPPGQGESADGPVKLPDSGFEWVSEYGSVTVNTEGLNFPDGGVNEAGLTVSEMSLPVTRFTDDPGKPKLFMSLWIQHLLDTCASVDETIASAKRVNLDGWNWHFFVTDVTGAAAVIEFVGGEVKVYAGEELAAPVLCNASYPYEVERLAGYGSPGFVQRLKGLFGKSPRFVRGARLLEAYDPSAGAAPLDYAWTVVEDLRIPGWNKWSFLFDVSGKTVYFNTEGDRGVRRFSYADADFSCATPARMLADVHASRPGDISGAFADYSAEANGGFALARAEQIFAERLRPLLENGLTVELYARRIARHPEESECIETK